MKMIKIGAAMPPETERASWARELLEIAMRRQVSVVEPGQMEGVSIQEFTLALPASLADQIEMLAQERNLCIPLLTAQLIDAVRAHPKVGVPEKSTDLPGQERVRTILLETLRQSVDLSNEGKIVFVEAATGTGKGRMIASLAAEAASQQETVVISCPLAVAWQIMRELAPIPEAREAGVGLVLGRPNFVSVETLTAWAQKKQHDQLLEWIQGGGQPTSAGAKLASALAGRPLCWLLDEAVAIAEDLPVALVTLQNDPDAEDCPAEKIYKSQLNAFEQKRCQILICSHHMLAAHVRRCQIRRLDPDTPEAESFAGMLPVRLGRVIVDEAHLLEGAFAAINSSALHLSSLIRTAQNVPGRAGKDLVASLSELSRCAQTIEDRVSESFLAQDHAGIHAALKQAHDCLAQALKKARGLDDKDKQILTVARHSIDIAMSGIHRMRIDFSPIIKNPRITIGASNITKSLEKLWDLTAGGTLVSATLYGAKENPWLIRWKLAVPKSRAAYLPAVIPAWVTDSVSLQKDRVITAPDDSDVWGQECAQKVQQIAINAKGGVLVLCTSFHNAEMLAKALEPDLKERLIVQGVSKNASQCAEAFAQAFRSGVKPVWIGLGSAWTGIDLSDTDVQPNEDYMLTDLVVSRLPIGLNRSLTHERRMKMRGFSVVAQEAVWQFRQGIGRLVRREGVPERKLWVLDSRLDETNTWASPMRNVLKSYDAS